MTRWTDKRYAAKDYQRRRRWALVIAAEAMNACPTVAESENEELARLVQHNVWTAAYREALRVMKLYGEDVKWERL